MPRYKQVVSLQTLSLKQIGALVTSMASPIIERIRSNDTHKIIDTLHQCSHWLNRLLLTHIHHYLYDLMAVEVLSAIKGLLDRTKKQYYPQKARSEFLTEMNVVVSLTEVVLSEHLKAIDLTKWPNIMRYVIVKNLYILVNVEVLNLGSCTDDWRSSEYDKYIINGIVRMKNLRSFCLCFECSDYIINVLAENCENIRCLDVTSSRSVTDRSIKSLLKCVKLTELELNGTSVTVAGLAKLLAGLPNLRNIGNCDNFDMVIYFLKATHPRLGPLGLKEIHTKELSEESHKQFVQIFPKIENITLFEIPPSSLEVYEKLKFLTDLNFFSCDFSLIQTTPFLQARGYNLTSLHFECIIGLPKNIILEIGKYCPKLEKLFLFYCDFTGTVAFDDETKNVFLELEKIFWDVDDDIGPLEFVLTNAKNIKYVHIGLSTDISHLSMISVLSVNPMKKLEDFRVLYSSTLNMTSVQLLLDSCRNLRVLYNLENWQGISIDEFREFKNYIIENNFDLDIRPTLL